MTGDVGGHSSDVDINQRSDGVSAVAAGDGRPACRGQGLAGEARHAEDEESSGCSQA